MHCRQMAGGDAAGDGLTRLGKASGKAAGDGLTRLGKAGSKVLSGSITVCRGDVQVAKSRSGARTPGTPVSGAQQRLHKLKLLKEGVETLPMGPTLSPTPLGSPE